MARSNSRSRGSGSRNLRSGSREDWSVGILEMAREMPVAAATIAIGAAAAAGVFLWSKRSQISNQLNSLSDQIGKWTESTGNEIRDDTAALAISSSAGRRSNGRAKSASKARRVTATSAYSKDIGTTDKTMPNSQSSTPPSAASPN